MDFLKKHIEKILFVLLLFVFGASLFLAMNAKGNLQQGIERSPNADKFDLTLDATGVQEAINQLKEDPPQLNVLTDAFTPEVRVICMNPADRTLIPIDAKICPYCGYEQTIRERDSDQDGIIDSLEAKWGLNPNDPTDAVVDLDNDGFPTIVEVENETDPTDTSDYPPLIDYIRLVDVEETSIEFMLNGTAKFGDKYTLQIYWEYPDENTGTTEYVKVGERFGRNNEFLAESFTEKRVQEGSKYIDKSRAVISSGRYQTSLGRVGDERFGKMTESKATIELIMGPEWNQLVRVDQTIELDKKSYKIVDINSQSVVIKLDDADSEIAEPITIRKPSQDELDVIQPPEDDQQLNPGEESFTLDPDFLNF